MIKQGKLKLNLSTYPYLNQCSSLVFHFKCRITTSTRSAACIKDLLSFLFLLHYINYHPSFLDSKSPSTTLLCQQRQQVNFDSGVPTVPYCEHSLQCCLQGFSRIFIPLFCMQP